MALDIKTNKDGNTLNITLGGRLDTTTAPQLNDITDDLSGIDNIIWDFNSLNYISSAGLRVLFKAHKAVSARGTMKVIGANDDIKEIFDITGSSSLFAIE